MRTLCIAIVAGLICCGCPPKRDYRQDMRDFVQEISAYAKQRDPGFLILPQNGQELMTRDGEETGPPELTYLQAIDGTGREDLFYGYSRDNVATPVSERNYMIAFLDIAENNGVEVMVTDYCWKTSYMDNAYAENEAKGYISFAADHRELDNIPGYPPTPHNVNADNVSSLAGARNFLYLINPGAFPDKAAFLGAVAGTDYDVVLIDLFFDDVQFSAAEVTTLKTKDNGGARLVLAYMSIGEAEDYRYYWQTAWDNNPPAWLLEENPDWAGNYKVNYWDAGWQGIITGNDGSYLGKILDAGFDGVYLDLIDAYEYFE